MVKFPKKLTVILIIAIVGLVLTMFFLLLPWYRAGNAMAADSHLTLTQQEDETLCLSWPESPSADEYLVEIYYLNDGLIPEESPVFSSVYSDTQCVLPAELPEDRPLSLHVSTQKAYRILGKERIRKGKLSVAVSCYLNRPEISDLNWVADAEQDTVAVSWHGWQGDLFYLYRVLPDGDAEIIQTPEQVCAELRFGPDGDFPVPEWDQDYVFMLNAVRELPGLTFIGKNSSTFTITREDLLGRELSPDCLDQGDNSYILTWEETKGDGYIVQYLNQDGNWETLREYGPSDERVYETGHLGSCSDYAFRVAATGGDTLPDSVFAAGPEQVELRTSASCLYATVWPTKDLDAFTGTGREEKLGTARTATAYCVLEEENDMFRVRFAPGEEGWIDSNYCMINLPDYIGGLCAYDITNSYSSIYLVHDYPIPEVSGTVVSGYENILLADGSFVVPLLYPVAKRLIPAAEAATLDGYRLKIYDSYRPNRATRAIYDLTDAILDDPVPEETWTRITLQDYLNGTGKNDSSAKQDKAEEPGETDRPTYREVMTNGTYNLGNFLALGGSLHNLGIAMDLTLERIDTGEELSAQTQMHDLSWYSVMWRNTDNANLLDHYMKDAGFGSIGSEWWHFQDNDARTTLNPPTVWAGVSVEGWKADDAGWRYRNADGSFRKETTAVIEGTEYRFDANGYVEASEI